jgi:hypothetical protein
MPERLMVAGNDRRNSGGRSLSQILQEIRGVIWTYAFHHLGEYEPGLVDCGVEVVACFAGHGADLNRKMGGLPSKVKLWRLFGQAPGNATNPVSLEASVKRGSAERRDPWLQVSQAKVEREASMFAEDDDERLLGRAQHG